MLNAYRPLARNRDFLVSVAGRCASRFGDEVAIVALTLRVQEAGGRPYLVALLLAAGLVPSIRARAWHTGPIPAGIDALPPVGSKHGARLRHLHRYFVRR